MIILHGSFDFQSSDFTNQLGVRRGDFLFLTDSSYRKTPTEENFVRLMSSITYDNRQEMQGLIGGDFFAYSGDLGSSVNLGGISFSKVYRIDPYFLKHPMLDLSGLISLPSEVEVYLDGMLIRKEKIPPGEFDLRNISYYGGARNVEIVIKDPFGREHRLIHPFYFTDIPLRKGLHEYSYNMGFLREEFGVKSNKYGKPALSAFHRYGISDSLTMGLRAEAVKGLYNFGPQASYVVPNVGIISAAMSGSTGENGKSGLAASLNHGYQGRRINTRLLLKEYTRDYTHLMSETMAEKTKYEAGAGIGYGTEGFGSLSLDFTEIKRYEGKYRQTLTATYSRSLTRKSTIFATFRNIRENGPANEFFLGITYYPWKDSSISARYEKTEDTNRGVFQVQKTPPVGEGIGYRVSLERVESHGDTTDTISPFLQYNAKYGIYTGEYRREYNGAGKTIESSYFSASGGIAYVGNTIGLSRPIEDSFGLVKIGNLEGVRVSAANQEIGRTDSSGKVFIPNLNSYLDNQVSINDKDIPMDYIISDVVKYVSPPLRSGTFIKFDVAKFQAITGMLKIKVNGDTKPVEFHEVKMVVDEKETTFPTGKGGEFYLENIKPGKYKASFDYMGKTCSFDIMIPKSDEMIVELGEIVYEDIR